MRRGHLALILHAHLPFVRHPEHAQFLEEEWLFEAITETYLPLIKMMQRLVRDGVRFKLSMSVTPTLCAMLADDLLRGRYVQHLDELIALTHREIERTRDNNRLHSLAQFYRERFEHCRQVFVEELGRDLLRALRELRDVGVLELLGCAATHAVLPLLQSSAAIDAQIAIGRDEHVRHFGSAPLGMWLPECAYSPQLDLPLQQTDVRWFVLDAHGLLYGNPPPQRAIYAHCYTPAGPAAFARDRETSRQVWSAHEGYPGDPAYRDFYRDIGFDLRPDYLGAKTRRFTGIKYHRVTAREGDKELYDPAAAQAVVENHARDFLDARRRQFGEIGGANFEPIIVAPFDAELFGHWWFEGPQFLEAFIRKAAEENAFGLTSPTEYLARFPSQQTLQPATSSWGANGYFEVWLNEKNAWIQPHVHAATARMCDLAQRSLNDDSQFTDRLLKQLARELLLAQASDWTFLINAGTATEYATERVKSHLLRLDKLHAQFTSGSVDEHFLADCEWRDNLFPNVNWRYYAK